MASTEQSHVHEECAVRSSSVEMTGQALIAAAIPSIPDNATSNTHFQASTAFLKKRYSLCQEEARSRTSIEESAFYSLGALHQWEQEAFEKLWDEENEAARALQGRLLQLTVRDEKYIQAMDEALKEKGRQEWREEKEAQRRHREAAKRLEKEMAELKRRQGAALTFIVTEEKRYRSFVEEELLMQYRLLAKEELYERIDIEKRAYALFMDASGKAAKREKERKKREKQLTKASEVINKHEQEQRDLIDGCHHAKGSKSVLTDPATKARCGGCGVKYDRVRGYWVRNCTSRLTLETKHKELSEAREIYAAIVSAKKEEAECERMRHEYFDNYNAEEVSLSFFFPQYYKSRDALEEVGGDIDTKKSRRRSSARRKVSVEGRESLPLLAPPLSPQTAKLSQSDKPVRRSCQLPLAPLRGSSLSQERRTASAK